MENEKREKIIQMLSEGKTYAEIQNTLGVSPSTISQVKIGGGSQKKADNVIHEIPVLSVEENEKQLKYRLELHAQQNRGYCNEYVRLYAQWKRHPSELNLFRLRNAAKLVIDGMISLW